MRHRLMGKQLSRTGPHRRAMRRNMAASLFQHGAIRTTETKAKEVRRFVEKLITMARKGTLHARRRVIAELQDREMTDDEGEFLDKTVVQKLFDEIAPRYASRPGGYTRIIRISDRRIGDAGKQVVLQLVEEAAPEAGGETPTAPSRRRRRSRKRIAHAAEAAGEGEATETAAAEEAPGEGEQEESAEQPAAEQTDEGEQTDGQEEEKSE